MTVLASGSKGNATVIAAGSTRILVDAGMSCRELMKRMAQVGEDPEDLDAILITHEHLDHVAGLSVLARRLKIPVFFTEGTHRAWVRMLTPRTTMTYAKWLDTVQREKEARADHAPAHTALMTEIDPDAADDPMEAEAAEPCAVAEAESPKVKADPAFLPAVEYFRAGHGFSIGEIDVNPFTIPHDAADPCGFVFHARSESIRMAIATDLGYVPPNVKMALRGVDVLLLESNHDLEMLKDGPYPWSVKQRVLSRVGHLSNAACAEFLLRDYDGGAHTIVLGHLSEQNNLPELAKLAAEQAIGGRMTLLGNRVVLAVQDSPLEPICL
ncbi:MBL fold metallo-hydrolase [Granulicella sp. L46]|jgi:phosphoribosyl 1,2-cyclic phosphodiesterase|uniref:MBL fold metallo-hydrolase n=1 Tax=Granulicella sp. L46 TaxID=1641865 RepID=UPI00131CB40B|nr:MBL fold metallo-hydrolase [Granulicella sp. L46]